MRDKRIDIIPIGNVEGRLLRVLSQLIVRRFGYACRINEAWEVPAYAYNPERKQYYSTLILKEICEWVKEDTIRAMGVTTLDLYIPIFTFVFGEAQLGSKCAIVSINRLRQEFYGIPRDEGLLLSRIEKESIHELAHTFGLTHCSDVNCVMHASYTIGDTDIKSNTFCSFCNSILTLKLEEIKRSL